MKLYIVRRDSNKIIGCFLNLERAKSCAEKEMDDQNAYHQKRFGVGFDCIKPRSHGLQSKLYCMEGCRRNVSSSNLHLSLPVVRIWIQEHRLNCSALELLGDQA